MNQLYGNEPAPVRFNTQKYLQGGRVAYQSGQLVQPGPGRQGYYGKPKQVLTTTQQQKIIDAFPEIKFNFKRGQNFGVKKYISGEGNLRKTNPDYTKVDRFIKKGFTTEMGEGLTTRGGQYSVEGKRLTPRQQEIIKSSFELPKGVKEWDFKTHKYGIKAAGRENLLAQMARKLKEKTPWTLAADRGSIKGWMMVQMNRVYKNEIKNPNIKKLTYEPEFDIFDDGSKDGRRIITGFKDNTKAGDGKTYYGLDKYTKKGAGDWTRHGDWDLNQKLVDITKKSGNAPNEVITGLLEKRGVKGKVTLNHLIHFLSGTEGTSKEVLKTAIARHHQSGVAFGSATDDLALVIRAINNRSSGIEARIRANNILPDDIQFLKNNNINVRGPDGTLYGPGESTPIDQFKQIEKKVESSIKSSKTFKGEPFSTKQLQTYIENLGCPGKASGGRASFKDGSTCYSRGVEKIKTGEIKTPAEKSNFSKLTKVTGGLKKLGRWLFGPVEMGTLPLFMAAEGLYSNYADKRDLKKALDRIPISEMPQYKKNLILEGYRQEARDIGDVGLETYAIDKPNVSGALEKIGFGDTKEFMDLSGQAITGIREAEAAEEAERYRKLYPEAQKEKFDVSKPMFKSGGKVDYDNYLPDPDNDDK